MGKDGLQRSAGSELRLTATSILTSGSSSCSLSGLSMRRTAQGLLRV